jgi:hypothetical protein
VEGRERAVIRRNSGPVVVTAVLVGLFLLALVLARAQGKLSLLALDLTEHLFGIVLAVFVFERMLAWREERRWLAAKNWLYMLLLETIDDLLKRLLPATVVRGEGAGGEEEISVYEAAGERIHFGESVAYSPLHLLVSPDERELQYYISQYAMEMGPTRYVNRASQALAEAREQVRDAFGASARLLDADITAMLIGLDQAAMAATRHLKSAADMRHEKVEGASRPADSSSAKRRTAGSDRELAFACGIIVESVVGSAIKPKAWLEDRMQGQGGR